MTELQSILYQLPEEEGKVQVVIKDETIIATQKAMAHQFNPKSHIGHQTTCGGPLCKDARPCVSSTPWGSSTPCVSYQYPVSL